MKSNRPLILVIRDLTCISIYVGGPLPLSDAPPLTDSINGAEGRLNKKSRGASVTD